MLRHSGVYRLRQSRLENYDHWLASNLPTVRTRANHRCWVVETGAGSEPRAVVHPAAEERLQRQPGGVVRKWSET